jgi:hypothetical protein
VSRQNATNFAGALQFPYANAPADLFKKEDLQVLAQAVDQHDHSSGKGLGLGAGVITSAMIVDGTIDTGDLKDGAVTSAKIADGTITSADIANGTITADDLAPGAATSLIGAFQTAPTFSSTTQATFVATPVGVSGTFGVYANFFVRITAGFCINHSAAAGAVVYAAIFRDGVNITGNMGVYQSGSAGQNLMLFLQFYDAPPAGAHTYQLYLYTGTPGTMSLTAGTPATMHVMEFRR